MNDLDTALRDLYTGRAGRAPSGADLLPVVHRRARRARRHRLLTIAAAVVVLIVVGGVWVVRPDDSRTLEVATVTGQKPEPAPISVGWLPDTYRERRVQYLGPESWAIDVNRDDQTVGLTVEVAARAPDTRPSTGTVDVGGTPAKLYWSPKQKTPNPFVELTYQRKPGQWIRIMAVNYGLMKTIVSEDDVVRIAESITDEPTPVVDVLTLTPPEGLEVGMMTRNSWGSTVGLIDAGTQPTGLTDRDVPNSHAGRLDVRVFVQLVRYDEQGQSFPKGNSVWQVRKSDIPPEGLVIKGDGDARWTTFLYPVPGRDGDVVQFDLFERDTPRSSDGALRALAKSVRIGPDAVFGKF